MSSWSVGGDPATCHLCEQSTDRYDEDLLPDRQELLGWRVWKPCAPPPGETAPPEGCFRPGGFECKACWDTRRRYYSKSKEELLEDMTTNKDIKVEFRTLRRKRVRGEDRYERRKTGPTTHSSKKAKEHFDEAYVEGEFIEIDDIVRRRTNFVPEKMSLDKKLQLVKSTLKLTPVKGKFGQWRVEVFEKGGYKIRRGLKQAAIQEEVDMHDNEDQAAVAVAEAFESIPPVRPFAALAFEAEASEVMGGGASGSGDRALAFAPARRDPSPLVSVHSRTASTVLTKTTLTRAKAMAPPPGEDGSDDEERADPEVGSKRGRGTSSKASSVDGSDRAADVSAAAAGGSGSVPGAPGAKQRKPGQKKKCLEATIKDGRDFLAENEATYEAERMWSMKMKRRDAQNAAARLNSQAQALAKTKDSRTDMLSGSMLELADQIQERCNLHVALKERPAMLVDAMTEQQLCEMQKYKDTLLHAVLSSVGVTLTSRADPEFAAKTLQLCRLRAFRDEAGRWRAQEGAQSQGLSLQLLLKFDEKGAGAEVVPAAATLQATIISMMVEKHLKGTSVAGFVETLANLPKADLKMQPLNFDNDDSQLADGFFMQARLDLSLAMLGARLLDAKQKTLGQDPSPELRAIARGLVKFKNKFSVRVRACCGPRSSGANVSQVGQSIMDLATHITARSRNCDQARAQFFEHARLAGAIKDNDDGAGLVDAVSEWYCEVQDLLSKMSELIEDIPNIDKDHEVVAVRVQFSKYFNLVLKAMDFVVLGEAKKFDAYLAERLSCSGSADDERHGDGGDGAACETLEWLLCAADMAEHLNKIGGCAEPFVSELWMRLAKFDEISGLVSKHGQMMSAAADDNMKIEGATALVKECSRAWVSWTQISASPSVGSRSDEGARLFQWLVRDIRGRSVDGALVKIVQCLAARPEVSAAVLHVATGLLGVLPAGAKDIVGTHSDWQVVLALSGKIEQGKALGTLELADGGKKASVIKGTIIASVTEQTRQEVCDRVLLSFDQSVRRIAQKYGFWKTKQVDEWLEQFKPVLSAAESWDFTGCEWHGKEGQDQIEQKVNAMENLVLSAGTQLRLIEAVLPATSWHAANADQLREVHSVLSAVQGKAKEIKITIASLALAEVFSKTTPTSSQSRDEEQAVAYVKTKLGLKDMSVFGRELPSRLAGKSGSGASGSGATSSEPTRAASGPSGRSMKKLRLS